MESELFLSEYYLVAWILLMCPSHVAITTYLCTSKPLTGAHSALLPASHMEIVNTSWIFNLDKI